MVENVILGGFAPPRPLFLCGHCAVCLFERDLNTCLGDDMRANSEFAKAIWGSLANVSWYKDGREVSYTFRGAGDLIAAIRNLGGYTENYMNFYCEAPYATVHPVMAERMCALGWTFEIDP